MRREDCQIHPPGDVDFACGAQFSRQLDWISPPNLGQFGSLPPGRSCYRLAPVFAPGGASCGALFPSSPSFCAHWRPLRRAIVAPLQARSRTSLAPSLPEPRLRLETSAPARPTKSEAPPPATTYCRSCPPAPTSSPSRSPDLRSTSSRTSSYRLLKRCASTLRCKWDRTPNR